VVIARRDGPLRVALEAIGGDGRRRCDVAAKEPSHVSLLEAGAVLQSRSSSAFGSDEDQGFARAPPMGSAATTHICFIDLDVIVQPVSTLTSGASPKLVHPRPRGLVRPEPEDSLMGATFTIAPLLRIMGATFTIAPLLRMGATHPSSCGPGVRYADRTQLRPAALAA